MAKPLKYQVEIEYQIKEKKGQIVKKSNEDTWSAQKAKLEELALEQTSADIALVEASRNLQAAQTAFATATARSTTAEKKLSAARGKLGER